MIIHYSTSMVIFIHPEPENIPFCEIMPNDYLQLCGIVCVQSLWSVWNEEKSIFRSLHELSIVSIIFIMFMFLLTMSSILTSDLQTPGSIPGDISSDILGIPGHTKIRSSLHFPPGYNKTKLGYNNPAFSTSISPLTQGGAPLSVTKYHNKTKGYIKR